MIFVLQTLTPDTTISDIRGRELPAVKVFACAIKYLVHYLLDNLKKWGSESFTINELNWVITVPAIWNDQAKRFMRRAAQEVSIKKNPISIGTITCLSFTYMCCFLTRQVYLWISLAWHWNPKLFLSTVNSFLLRNSRTQTQSAHFSPRASTLF